MFPPASSVQFSGSVVSDFLQPHELQPARPLYHQLPEFRLTSIESVMPSSHLILCCPLLLLPSIPHSIRVFSNESALRMRWPKYWSFSFSIIPSKESPGLISFRKITYKITHREYAVKTQLKLLTVNKTKLPTATAIRTMLLMVT